MIDFFDIMIEVLNTTLPITYIIMASTSVPKSLNKNCVQ